MKQVTLTVKEFYFFKQFAVFLYEFSVIKDSVIIKADSHQLELLGY